jgi:hypothetical protein
MGLNDAKKTINQLKEKSEYVPVQKNKKNFFGLIAKTIEGKESLRESGVYVWDVDDL